MKLHTLKPKVSTVPARLDTLSPGSWRAGSAGSTERGYGYAWQKAREHFLAQHPTCVMCEARGLIVAATIVDHVTPHRGNQTLFWDETNWQSLCKPHHDGEKQRQERAADRA
jgi:5-methylcytosine-specific restriction protein A